MTRFRQFIILVFILSMVLSFAGCGNQTNTENQGLATVEGKYLANGGATEYKIVIPADASGLVRIASSDFNLFFSKSTGVSIPVITDSEVTGDGSYISVGETTLLQNTNISYSYDELGRDGYKIITKGDDLYLIGGAEYGTLYAVYELLEILVGFDFFAEDCYTKLAQPSICIPSERIRPRYPCYLLRTIDNNRGIATQRPLQPPGCS